jgi:uncharacterized protein YdaU (DUF1376 family)
VNYYPHHIGDFNNATRHLTRIERSVYRDLIELYYDTEQPIPLDMKNVCRKILATSEQDSTAVQQVLNEFFTETEQGWHHARCEQEILAFHTNISAKSLAGKASAAKREESRLKRLAELNGSSTHVEQVLNSVDSSVQLTKNLEPITKNLKPSKSKTKTAKPAATPLVFPDWMPMEAWGKYLAMRVTLKKPITEHGIPLAIKRLEKLRAAGADPSDVLDHSTMNSYQGLFEPPVSRSSGPPSVGYESPKDRNRRLLAEQTNGVTHEPETDFIDLIPGT